MGSLFQASTIPVLEQWVGFAQARHNVLAGNLANLDTPGYVARDLSPADFQMRLRKAIEAQRQPRPSGSPGEIASPAPLGEVTTRTESILFHDQSQVGAEQQVSEMVKNRMQHNLAIAILSQQFRLLQAAISERA